MEEEEGVIGGTRRGHGALHASRAIIAHSYASRLSLPPSTLPCICPCIRCQTSFPVYPRLYILSRVSAAEHPPDALAAPLAVYPCIQHGEWAEHVAQYGAAHGDTEGAVSPWAY
jgi:hypothetical protein